MEVNVMEKVDEDHELQHALSFLLNSQYQFPDTPLHVTFM